MKTRRHPPLHKRLRAWMWGAIELAALWRAHTLGHKTLGR
jgi:hypothetical protein